MLKSERKVMIDKMITYLPILRKAYGISQTALADYLGVTRNTIINIENRHTDLSFAEYISLFYMFNKEEESRKLLSSLGIENPIYQESEEDIKKKRLTHYAATLRDDYDFIFVINLKTNTLVPVLENTTYSKVLSKYLELPALECMNAFFDELVYEEDKKYFKSYISSSIQKRVLKDKIKGDIRFKIDNEIIYHRLNISLDNEDKNSIIVGFRNINQRKKNEVKATELNTLIQELMKDYIFLASIDIKKHNIGLYRNNGLFKDFEKTFYSNLSADTKVKLFVQKFIIKEDRKYFKDQISRIVFNKENNFNGSKLIYFRSLVNEKIQWFKCKISHFHGDNEDKFYVGIVDISIEISERLEKNKKYSYFDNISNLNKNELSLFLNSIPGGFCIVEAYGKEKILFYNDLLVKYFGFENGKDFESHVDTSFKGFMFENDVETAKNKISHELELSDDLVHAKIRIRKRNNEVGFLDTYGKYIHSETYGDIYCVFANEIVETQSNINIDKKYIDTYQSTTIENYDIFKESRILVIDENDVNRGKIRDKLESCGAIVAEAQNGVIALNEFNKDETFDLVLLSSYLSDMDDIELIKTIRSLEYTRDFKTPIVITGQINDQSDLDLEANLYAYFIKSLDFSKISKILFESMRTKIAIYESELKSTIKLANTDALTKVKNITAYAAKIDELNKLINSKEEVKFAVVLCDVNDLKKENDAYGHASGDLYIKNCCRIIANSFKKSPVYRIGGDEFAVIVEGDDFDNLSQIIKTMDEIIINDMKIDLSINGKASFSFGFAIYDPKVDISVKQTINRADLEMYERKEQFKKEKRL